MQQQASLIQLEGQGGPLHAPLQKGSNEARQPVAAFVAISRASEHIMQPGDAAYAVRRYMIVSCAAARAFLCSSSDIAMMHVKMSESDLIVKLRQPDKIGRASRHLPLSLHECRTTLMDWH